MWNNFWGKISSTNGLTGVVPEGPFQPYGNVWRYSNIGTVVVRRIVAKHYAPYIPRPMPYSNFYLASQYSSFTWKIVVAEWGRLKLSSHHSTRLSIWLHPKQSASHYLVSITLHFYFCTTSKFCFLLNNKITRGSGTVALLLRKKLFLTRRYNVFFRKQASDSEFSQTTQLVIWKQVLNPSNCRP